MPCKFCERPATARGLCLMHYKREIRRGTLAQHDKQPLTLAHNRLDLTGQRFSRVTVLGSAGSREYGQSKKSRWLCKCDCGTEKVFDGSSLMSGNTVSCGCFARERLGKLSATHGMTETRVYRIWQAMLTRCRNKNTVNYENYGGRGISVCERWLSFENFLSDMGEPETGQSIDRIDNDGNYEPNNCRWATREMQSKNKRSNRVLTLNGDSKTLSEWAKQLGIDQASLRERLEKWSLEKSLTQPKKRYSNERILSNS